MERLTPQEENVMLYVWSMKNCYVKDVLAKFPDPKPPYTTVASVMTNLKRKRYVRTKQYGNTYLYTPIIKQKDYSSNFMNRVVNDFFANSYKEIVSFFAKEQKISADDLKEIIDTIEKGKE